MKIALAAIAFLALGADAAEIVPAQPLAFEPVNLRLTVDSCSFVPGTVRVHAAGGVLRLTQQQNQCFAPGTPEVVDIRLGSFAPGDYSVEVYGAATADGAPAERLAFAVRERVEIAVFPPPPRPLTDYTGMWWNPLESGWGLSLHQSARTDAVFGAWFVYGADGAPVWFTLQGGQWTGSTRWTGTVYRTTGTYYGAPEYVSSMLAAQPVGNAVLDFRQLPGDTGHARFTYTVDGVTRTRVIERMAF